MSDNPLKIEVSIPDEVTKEVLIGPAKTFRDVWDFVFGDFGHFVDKKRIKRAHDLLVYQAEINAETSKIPPEYLQEPQLSVIGPALEASKYYIEEEDLRKMFARLIASSMNSSIASKVRTSFVESIKQMEPLDASNLLLFKEKSDHPIVQVFLNIVGGSTAQVTPVLFISNHFENDLNRQATSLFNLQRLGFIELSFARWLHGSEHYAPFYQLREVTRFTSLKGQTDAGIHSAEVKKGKCSLTPLGKDFISVCL